MRSGFVRWTASALLSVGLATVARAATPIFLLDTDQSTYVRIFRVDRTSGQLTTVGTLPTVLGSVLSLAASSGQQLYAVTEGGEVLTITTSPFAFQTLGNIGFNQITGLAASGGRLYAIDEGTSALSVIQLSPLVQTMVGAVHLANGSPLTLSGGDLAQDASGTWYVWTNATQALYQLDVTTAVATPVPAQVTGGGGLSGLAFDYQGGDALLASSGALDALLTLDPASGGPIASVPLCLDCPTVYDAQAGDLATPRCTDADGDGYAPEGGPCGPVDCDDSNPAVHPGAPEVCNGIDDDCNGIVDDEPAASASCVTACTATASCVAGSCATTPIICDDGNPCTADGCDPVLGCRFVPQPDGLACFDGDFCAGPEACRTGQCTPTGGPSACTPGSRSRTTCAAEWFVDDPRNPGGVLSATQRCQQGDPTCDHDADPGTCTFHVAVCLRVSDPRLLPACTPTDVVGLSLLAPALARDPAAANAILGALLALPGATLGGRQGQDVSFSPPVHGETCTAAVDLVVPVGGRLAVRSRTTVATGQRSGDTLRLRCEGP
ncbi:MAG TPA: putative metal-binding motif-containing protein [Candidatus Binatia bacterium]|nr:putative metal-binding motif-containing protein [Candidatus Binatia bacterium]